MKMEKGIIELNGEKFYVEPLAKHTLTLTKIKKIYYTKKSKFQLIEVVESYDYGKGLYLDHSSQLSEIDEYMYHEVFVHPVMLGHPNPKRILIIGGGDGGALREVLKHPTVEKAVLVEIDEEVIKAVKRYLPFIPQNAFEDPRTKILIEDGVKYVYSTNEKYDVIIMDATDDIGPSVPLYKVEFYKAVKNILSHDGIFITQALGLEQHKGALEKIYFDLRKVFKKVDFYYMFIPSFCNRWGFVFASDVYNVMEMEKEEIEKRFMKRKIKTKFYNPEVHIALQIMRKTIKLKYRCESTH